MYLKNVINNDPQLFETTLKLHQEGKIPPSTWVINLDRIVENAKALSTKAESLGLIMYLMGKQHNRNPYINALAIAHGLNKIVAVDTTCALLADRYNLPLGHVGHLNQIPKHLVPLIVSYKPEVITIYNLEHAKWIDEAASSLGIVQDLLIRVYKDDDIFFDGQEGGFDISEIDSIIDSLAKLKNVKLVGVTSFPCVKYNETEKDSVSLTSNMDTVLSAVEIMEKKGLEVKQINAPGNTSCEIMDDLKERGATHIEPGNGLLGTTPSHAFRSDLPEKTAFVYLTEISHYFKKNAYAYGGGVYHTNYSDKINALVGNKWPDAKDNKINYHYNVVQDIDYHMQLTPKDGQRCEAGDSVMFAYRTQMHMTRTYVAPISGLSGKRDIRLHYLFDNACNALDKNFNPVDSKIVCDDINELLKTY